MVVLLLILLFGVMSNGTPVAFAITLVSLLYIILTSDVPSIIFVKRIADGLDSFPLLDNVIVRTDMVTQLIEL